MKKILAIALFSFALAAPAFAADSGVFGALDLQTWSLTNLNGGKNPSSGFRIDGGYHFTQNFGVEINYAQSGNADQADGTSYKGDSTQAAAVGTYPINDIFNVYAKLGIAANKVSESAVSSGCSCSKTSVMCAVGGQYHINKDVGVRLEYHALGDVTNNSGGGIILLQVK